MSKTVSKVVSTTGVDPGTGWKERRRRAGQAAIVDAAWELAGEHGLSGLSMRELARRAGVTTPTLYAYFDSKNEIYDAMFRQAAGRFFDHVSAPLASPAEHSAHDSAHDSAERLEEGLRRFVEFCTEDVARYQLLFQRVIPDFEPSPESYAPAVAALECTKARLAEVGCGGPDHVDMWTAMVTGLVDQQISNDPGGDRWTSLSRKFVDMFVIYCRTATPIDKNGKGVQR